MVNWNQQNIPFAIAKEYFVNTSAQWRAEGKGQIRWCRTLRHDTSTNTMSPEYPLIPIIIIKTATE